MRDIATDWPGANDLIPIFNCDDPRCDRRARVRSSFYLHGGKSLCPDCWQKANEIAVQLPVDYVERRRRLIRREPPATMRDPGQLFSWAMLDAMAGDMEPAEDAARRIVALEFPEFDQTQPIQFYGREFQPVYTLRGVRRLPVSTA